MPAWALRLFGGVTTDQVERCPACCAFLDFCPDVIGFDQHRREECPTVEQSPHVFSTSWQSTRTDPIHEIRLQAQLDARANVFYVLQSLPAGDKGRIIGVEFPSSAAVIP